MRRAAWRSFVGRFSRQSWLIVPVVVVVPSCFFAIWQRCKTGPLLLGNMSADND